MLTDPIGDMLARIRNGQHARRSAVRCPASKGRERVLAVLLQEGYIRAFRRHDQGGGKSEIEIELKYHEGQPVIREMARASRPGRRLYSSIADLPRVYNGLGVSILSTPKGVMSDREARERNLGGEVICHVF